MVRKSNNWLVTDTSKLDIPQYIDQPHFVQNKTSGYTLQILGWFVFMSLFFPVITLTLWLFEITTIEHFLFNDGDILKKNIIEMTLYIFICILMLLVWASYNWLRFKNNNRRKKQENTATRVFAKNFNITSNELLYLQQQDNITLVYNKHGTLICNDLTKSD